METILFIIIVLFGDVISQAAEDDGLVGLNKTITTPKKMHGGFCGLNATGVFAIAFTLIFIGTALYYAHYCYPVYCPDRFREEDDAVDQELIERQVLNHNAVVNEELEKLNIAPQIHTIDRNDEDLELGERLGWYHVVIHFIKSQIKKRLYNN
ncbi:hypothetical protein PPYR_08043 [Photinus pyralis]|uniref:Uncharacterized protein n=1 Tax=Photinus pyralis TaxID=7054 RepID=A0A1Y1L173_PHOPY|nr:uncharacterized protein LOC116169746 [Photinus pyralis]XP_031355308.1 uncharacterized protein LOC116179641 [Photinus pyralis]KAB0792984.1 hypothetical protein PPYR_12604 [Photinus pyralis]KAB0800163.1 hypothetical protein PPYR_08043 [Photinus pyralis]